MRDDSSGALGEVGDSLNNLPELGNSDHIIQLGLKRERYPSHQEAAVN